MAFQGIRLTFQYSIRAQQRSSLEIGDHYVSIDGLVPLILAFMGAIACCLAIAFLGVYVLNLPSISS